MIDQELEHYYFHLKAMFRSEGWKLFLEDLKDSAEAVDSIEHTKTLEELYLRKGQLSVIANCLNHEEQIYSAEEDQESVH